jgi:hypothetical protein
MSIVLWFKKLLLRMRNIYKFKKAQGKANACFWFFREREVGKSRVVDLYYKTVIVQ